MNADSPSDHVWDTLVNRARKAAETSDKKIDERHRDMTTGVAQFEANAKFDEGLRLIRIGRKAEALEVWERALELDPENRRYQSNIRRLRKLIEDGHSR